MEIKFRGETYRACGDNDAEHGVFFEAFTGCMFRGRIDNGAARLGKENWGNGTVGGESFVECDANGQFHGRVLVCRDRVGETEYELFEHGSRKEWAKVFGNGTCEYNGESCSADDLRFLQLKAKVLPIKARPH
jgi:hypothetical protein